MFNPFFRNFVCIQKFSESFDAQGKIVRLLKKYKNFFYIISQFCLRLVILLKNFCILSLTTQFALRTDSNQTVWPSYYKGIYEI